MFTIQVFLLDKVREVYNCCLKIDSSLQKRNGNENPKKNKAKRAASESSSAVKTSVKWLSYSSKWIIELRVVG